MMMMIIMIIIIITISCFVVCSTGAARCRRRGSNCIAVWVAQNGLIGDGRRGCRVPILVAMNDVAALRNPRIPSQVLHQLLAVLRVHELVHALMTNIRLDARCSSGGLVG